MDDPLTKWLHLHSNINNTAGTVSAEKYIYPFQPTFKRANLDLKYNGATRDTFSQFLILRDRGRLTTDEWPIDKLPGIKVYAFMAALLRNGNIIFRRFYFFYYFHGTQ